MELERRRCLAVRRFCGGDSIPEIADFLEVTPRSVQRWVATSARLGTDALKAVAASGRPAKLDRTQEKIVHRWLLQSPRELGFATELWTAKRLAHLIRATWDISYNPRYLCDWLGQRGYTAQKPQRVPRERDAQAIQGWCRRDWPRIQKKLAESVESSSLSTKAAC